MNNDNKNIDQLFKQKLENFELSSQGSSWKMLQMAKDRKLRSEKILFAKTLAEMTLLFSLTVFLVFSRESVTESSDLRLRQTDESQQSMIEANEIEVISEYGQGATTKEMVSELSTFFSPKSKRNTVSELNSELNRSNVKYESKDGRRELISESLTRYIKWTHAEKSKVQKISQIEINSSFDEYAPVINKDGSFMFFTSRRPITSKEIRKGVGRERIYYAEKNEVGWTDAKLLESPINTSNNYNSAVALSNDGKSLFIYRDDRYGNGDLFVSHLSGFKWSTPEPLPSPINSVFHESSLSISTDGNTLFFTSNRDGGVGGMDIWYTKKNKAGTWGDAKNLGDIVNTEGDEEGVFIHPDGKTLYFSSRGHEGFGGYDIYYSKLEDGKWSKPVNMGSDVNTKNDDVYFVLENNGTDAYYTSVNPKTPDQKDIFKIKASQGRYKKHATKDYSILNGTVLIKGTKKSLKARIDVFEESNNVLVSSLESDSKTGRFSIPLSLDKSYRIHIYKEGFLYYTEQILPQSTRNNEVIDKQILLDPLQANTQFTLKKWRLNGGCSDELDHFELKGLYQLMKTNPQLKIQFSLEMNSIKDSSFNPCERIVEETINYLKSKGIDKNRIEMNTLFTKSNELKSNSSELHVNIIKM